MTDLLDELERLARAATFVPGYSINRYGVCFSESGWRGHDERVLKAFANSHGYLRVRCVVDGKRRSFFIHKLVAAKFLPPRPSKHHELRHLNGIRTDNRATNLAWGTRKENAADRASHGNTASGERNGFAKLADVDRIEIVFSDLPTAELAARYKIDPTTVRRIRRGAWTT